MIYAFFCTAALLAVGGIAAALGIFDVSMQQPPSALISLSRKRKTKAMGTKPSENVDMEAAHKN